MIQFNPWNVFAGLLAAILFGLWILGFKKCPECGGRATLFLCESNETTLGMNWERDYLGCKSCNRVFTRTRDQKGNHDWYESCKFLDYPSFREYWRAPAD